MSKIKVLRIVPSLEVGGVEKTLLSLLPRLKKEGFDVSVCCLYKRDDLAKDMERMGIPIHFIGMRPQIDFDLRYLRGIYKLIKFLKKEKIQIVHTHMYKANTPGRIAAIFARVPVIIVNEHNIDDWKNPFQIFTDRVLANFTSKIVTVSDAVRKFYIKKGIPAHKLITIHNGVDLDRFKVNVDADRKKEEFGINSSDFVVGTISRIEPQKGHKYLIDAASTVRKEFPNVKFLIVGTGSLKNKLKKYVKNKGLEKDIIFTDKRKDIPEILSIMDVFALPSLREGFSISLLEAMAAGRVVVATDVGGNLEVIDNGENGFIIPANSPRILAEKIIKILKDQKLRNRIGKNAQEKVREFSIDNMASKTMELYNKMLALH
jgi:glycosyltransferase involved in cell wall biosynthesis